MSDEAKVYLDVGQLPSSLEDKLTEAVARFEKDVKGFYYSLLGVLADVNMRGKHKIESSGKYIHPDTLRNIQITLGNGFSNGLICMAVDIAFALDLIERKEDSKGSTVERIDSIICRLIAEQERLLKVTLAEAKVEKEEAKKEVLH